MYRVLLTTSVCHWESTVTVLCSRRVNPHQFHEFLLEVEAEYPDLSYPQQFSGLAVVIIAISGAQSQDWNFSEWEKCCCLSLLWKTEWPWKLVFATDLIMFLNEFHMNLQGNYNHSNNLQLTITVKLISTGMLYSQVMPTCMICFSYCQTLKQGVRVPFAATVFSGLKYSSSRTSQILIQIQRKSLYFKNWFNWNWRTSTQPSVNGDYSTM